MAKFDWVDDGYFDTESRDIAAIRRVLLETMLLNFLATAIKLAAGLATGALSIVADGFDSLFDGLSNVVGLAGMLAAARPPDAEHPYGHRKFETIAALIISFLLFLTCWQLLLTAWGRLGSGESPQVNTWTVIAMLASILVQFGTSFYELRAGRRLGSEVLIADALHTRASILVSGSVLVGLAFVRVGFPRADAFLAIFVAFVIAKIGIDILREAIPVLVDRAVLDPRKIAAVVTEVGGVESFHRVRSRGPVGGAAVDLHVRVSPEKTVQEADAIGAEVRRRLLAMPEVSDVTVHLEAQRGEPSESGEMFAVLNHTAEEFGVRVYESWAHRLDGRLYLEVHIGVDPGLTLGQAHEIAERLENAMRTRLPELDAVHTHIEMATARVEEAAGVPAELAASVRGEVIDIVQGMQGIDNPHNIIVRQQAGESGLFVSLEATAAADTPLPDAHHLSDQLEHELSLRLAGVIDVFVHLEPPGAN